MLIRKKELRERLYREWMTTGAMSSHGTARVKHRNRGLSGDSREDSHGPFGVGLLSHRIPRSATPAGGI